MKDISAISVDEFKKALKRLEIETKKKNGDIKTMPEILEDLSAKWNSCNKETQDYITEILAGEGDDK